MNKTFEYELPENYKVAKTIDASDKKIGIIMNVLALLIALILIVVGIFVFVGVKSDIEFELSEIGESVLPSFGLCVGIILYMVLHELVHGLVYKLETKQKLTFGIKLTCAYCGVPNIYVYRKSAILAAIMPFIVFNVLFIILLVLINNFFLYFAVLVLFSIHFGGCVGDLYVVGIMLFKFKDNGTLMNDTGPKQTFYVKGE